MDVSQTAAQPAWWSQSFQSGERDVKEDVRQPGRLTDSAGAADDAGWGADGFGFDDFVDIVNPLQHLPFISTLYREFTGDTIAPAARTAGGALYGGPAGLIAGVANVIFEAEHGSDIGATVVAELTERGDGAVPTEATAIAEAPPVPAKDHRGFAVPGLHTASADAAAMTPEAMAAYARASALTVPTPGHGSVDWTSGVITPSAAESDPALPSVSGGGLDALIRQSQAKTATRRRGTALPSLVQPGLKTRGAQAAASQQALPIDPSQRVGLADWMMKALDKYESMKVSSTG